MSTPLEIRGLRKSFGGNSVLKGVDLTFIPGQIHALLGPNGAGKSTTLGCITGAQSPDDGEIIVGGRSYSSLTPRTAREAGIAIIYQHPQLAGDLSIADNIFLGRELTSFGHVDSARQESESRRALGSLGVELDVKRRVRDLSIGEQQIVEIARALADQPSVLILDEPTSALSDSETAHLLETMQRLARDRQIVVVFVTHILKEVMVAADEVTIIRDGRVLWTRSCDDVTLHDLIEAISPSAPQRVARPWTEDRPTLVRLQDYQTDFTGPVSLEIGRGEIVGLFGALGSGRTDLLESIAGAGRHSTGTLTIDDRSRRIHSPASALAAGVALVPADRKAQAIFGEMNATENLVMPFLSQLTHGIRSARNERRLFARAASSVTLSPPDPKQDGALFSGGNAQKLVLSRWVTGINPRDVQLLLLDEPTQGVDIGSRYEIYDLIRSFVSDGKRSALFASNEPEEVLTLADRVVVLSKGRVVDVVPTRNLDEAALLSLAHS